MRKNGINRKQFLHRSLLGAGSLLFLPGFGYMRTTSQEEYVIADTESGRVRGFRERGVSIFRGIPYGGSVSGKYRFVRPAPLKPWKGIRDALLLGNPAMQMPKQTYGINEPAPAEDCLFLNIWTPANDSNKRPVMFYNHGGGFSTGSGGSVAQDGANLARYFDVVVVETNHRLNLFGYLYLGEVAGNDYSTSGNNGMLDIIDALKWVNRNISGFGGDPSNVMIFGESGGGAKTSCLYAMPEASPYFNKASIESGPGIQMTSLETAAVTTDLLLRELNIIPAEWQKLLEIPSSDLLSVQQKLPSLASSGKPVAGKRGIGASDAGGFSPVVDGITLPCNPFDPVAPEISSDKPLITGWNEDEYTFFAMFGGDASQFNLSFDELKTKLERRYGEDAERIIDTYRMSRPEATATNIFVEVMSVAMMGLGSIEIAEKKALQGKTPVYLYNFGFKSGSMVPGTSYPMGTPHAMDIAYKFNNVRPEDPMTSGGVLTGTRPERFRVSATFAELWTTFARTGVPAANGQPSWPAYNSDTRATFIIDDPCRVINDRNRSERELWKDLRFMG